MKPRDSASVLARHERIMELRGQGKSSVEIGRIMGLDHTSVLYHSGGMAKHCNCRSLPDTEFQRLALEARCEYLLAEIKRLRDDIARLGQ